MNAQSYKMVAIQAGDALKYLTTVNEVDRAATSVFNFTCDDFPNQSITSARAKRVHDWILSLSQQKLTEEERKKKLIAFLNLITPEGERGTIEKILSDAGIREFEKAEHKKFMDREFHREINLHCKKLFLDRHYFHSVFEAAKIYHRQVQEKSQSSKDGQSLMLEMWNPEKGVLKITKCETETDKNVQEGIGFLSAGLMRAVRNPTAHVPAHEWPISEDECLDILSFISFLLKKLDQAVYYKESK